MQWIIDGASYAQGLTHIRHPTARALPALQVHERGRGHFRCLRAAGAIGAFDGLDRAGAGIHAAVPTPFQRLQYFDLPVSSREPAAPVLQAGALLRPRRAQHGSIRHRSRFCPSSAPRCSINPIHVSAFLAFCRFFPTILTACRIVPSTALSIQRAPHAETRLVLCRATITVAFVTAGGGVDNMRDPALRQDRTGCPIARRLPSLSRNQAPRSPIPLLA